VLRVSEIGVVVPTKDRPHDLGMLLENLEGQAVPPARVVVVDGGDEPVESLVHGRRYAFPVQYLRHRPPSAAAQRNAGIALLKGRYRLIGLLDDDIQLAPDALRYMAAFWESDRGVGVAGAAFCQEGQEALQRGGFLKRSRFSEALGLYSRQPGRVAASGWHAPVGTVTEDTPVDWLQTGAAVWRSEVFDGHRFDERFHSYSYLEDLDFSYGVSRSARLVVVANARYRHFDHHSNLSGAWYRRFGEMEVRNRLYFVRKHHLSVASCYLGLGIRFFQTLGEAMLSRRRVLLSRATGNLRGFSRELGARLSGPRGGG